MVIVKKLEILNLQKKTLDNLKNKQLKRFKQKFKKFVPKLK